MKFKLIISLIIITIGFVFTFFNKSILKFQGLSKNDDKWHISNKDRLLRMKIAGIALLFYGILYLLFNNLF